MKYFWIALTLFSAFLSGAPQVVVFDFGGVIADVNRGPFLHFISDSLNIPYSQVKRDLRRDALYEYLLNSKEKWPNYAGHDLSSQWSEEMAAKSLAIVTPIEGMERLIDRLKNQGYQLALLSNTGKARSAFLRSIGMYAPFSVTVLSCDVGGTKPEPLIYKELLKELKCSPEQCLFIDNKKANVKAAKKLGMDGILFQSAEQLEREFIHREIL